jgi:hypothetical protein
MRVWFCYVAIGILATATLFSLGFRSAIAESHPHVYLFRGLADVFSTGMDTLADELNKRRIHATSHSHTDWKAIADRAAADYKAKKEGSIILIGHSLGADAVMEMADYLGDKGVPVALVVPFDGTQSFPVPGNVARVVNFTQRDYAYMRPGPGFRGSLNNVDLSTNHDISHLNNVTGTTFLGPELVTKRLELLSEVVPQHSHVAILWHPHAYSDRTMDRMYKEAEHAAETLGMQLQFVPATNPEEITGAFSGITRDRADALSVFPSPMLFAEYSRIVSIAAEKRLPTIYAAREGVELGGLMSYGANLADLGRQTAPYLDKILKGAKPAELPVQQPTKFELVINLKAAKALGLTITRDFLLIADEVIE